VPTGFDGFDWLHLDFALVGDNLFGFVLNCQWEVALNDQLKN
jgi:hypothetical protein